MVSCLALLIVCTGDTGPQGPKGDTGAKGDTGSKGDPGDSGGPGTTNPGTNNPGDGEKDGSSPIKTVEDLRAAIASKSVSSDTIVIDGNIMDFYTGSDEVVETADGDTRVNNLLGYRASTSALSYYIVDPIVIENNTGRVQYITGVPVNGVNPKINASLVIRNGDVRIANLDFEPSIAVCVNGLSDLKNVPAGTYYSTTGTAIAIKDMTNGETDWVCTGEQQYAGIVVEPNATLDLYESNIDMSKAAGLTRTVGTKAINAQTKAGIASDKTAYDKYQAEPLSAVYVDYFIYGPPDRTSAYLYNVGITNEGRYGLTARDIDNVQIRGGEFEAAGFAMVLDVDTGVSGGDVGAVNLTPAKTAHDLKSVWTDAYWLRNNEDKNTLDITDAALVENTPFLNDFTSGGDVDREGRLDDYLAGLKTYTNANHAVGNIVSTSAIYLSELATGSSITVFNTANTWTDVSPYFGNLILSDVTNADPDELTAIRAVQAGTFTIATLAGYTTHVGSSCTGLSDVKCVIKNYHALTDALRQMAAFDAMTQALVTDGAIAAGPAVIKWAADAAENKAAEDGAKVALAEVKKEAIKKLKVDEAEAEEIAKDKVYAAILENPEFEGAVIDWAYGYTYGGSSYDYNFTYDYKYTVEFDLVYGNPLWEYTLVPPGDEDEQRLATWPVKFEAEKKAVKLNLTAPLTTAEYTQKAGNVEIFADGEELDEWLYGADE